MFSNRTNLVCVFKCLRFHYCLHGFRVKRRSKCNDIVTGPKAPVTGMCFHLKTQQYNCGFASCLHGNNENDHEKATHLNMQSKVDRFENATK